MQKLRNSIGNWLIDLGFKVMGSPNRYGEAGFNQINYQGKPLTADDIPKGRVVKITAPPEYDPDQKRTGGRMVRRMPKQLQKMKEAQEKS